MISRALNLIFIHIPKTGGHSIDRFFLDRGLVLKEDERWHETAPQILDYLGPYYGECFSFSVIRNPWERMVSQWAWQSATDYKDQLATEWGNKGITFEAFLKSDFHWYTQKQLDNGHLSDQSHFIYDSDGNSLVGEVIRFEDLSAAFTRICRRCKLRHDDLQHLNRSHHDHYTKYYTDELVEIVSRMWPRDVEMLGYKFGD